MERRPLLPSFTGLQWQVRELTGSGFYFAYGHMLGYSKWGLGDAEWLRFLLCLLFGSFSFSTSSSYRFYYSITILLHRHSWCIMFYVEAGWHHRYVAGLVQTLNYMCSHRSYWPDWMWQPICANDPSDRHPTSTHNMGEVSCPRTQSQTRMEWDLNHQPFCDWSPRPILWAIVTPLPYLGSDQQPSSVGRTR